MKDPGYIGVDFGKLGQTAENVSGVAKAMETKLGDLKGYLAPTAAKWTGKASEAWAVNQRDWNNAYVELKDVLAQVSIAVKQANEAYQQAERENIKRWG